MKRVFRLVHRQARDNALECVRMAPEGWEVILKEPSRNNDQNSLLWVCLTAFSKQLQWPVNGELVWMSPEEWKDVLSAAYMRETRVAEGLEGGHVMIGQKTSHYTVRQMSEFLEFIQAVAADRGVFL